jgi:hypothetical protein
MNFNLAKLVFDHSITINLPIGRPRIGTMPTQFGERTITELDCCFTLNTVTRTIHAEMPPIPRPLLIYGPADFAAAAADTPEQHVERVRSILGEDPVITLQALANGDPVQPPKPRVPPEIPNWRAKAILSQMGMLEKIETAMESLPEPQRTIVTLAWNGDAKLARNGQTVIALAAALGLSSLQVDDLFVAAEAIQV